MALLFFLLCSMAGSVILAAGTTAAGTLSQVKEGEQAYYTVTSAAQLIEKEIENQPFIYYKKEPKTPPTGTTTEDFRPSGKPGGKLSDLLSTAAISVFSDGVKYENEFTMDTTNPSLHPELSAVTGEFVMKPNYDIEITLRLADGDGAGLYTCKLNIKANAQHINDETETVDIYGHVFREIETRLSWGKATIIKVN